MEISRKNTHLFWLIAILSVGFGLRLYRLDVNSLWFDECLPLISTTRDFKNALFSGKFYCPIVYGAFIHSYGKLIGNNDFLLRMSSLIFGTLSIYLLYRLGSMLFDETVGLFSAFVLSISPFHIYYSQEIRMYSLISLLTLCSVFLLLKAIRENKDSYWTGYVICNILNIYVHPATVFVLLAEVIFFITYIKKYFHFINKWVRAHIFLFIFLIPWIISIIGGTILSRDKNNWFFVATLSWIKIPALIDVFYTFKNFTVGYHAIKQIYLPATLLFFILFSIGVSASINKKEGLVLSILCLFIPILCVYFLSKFLPFYIDRYFIPSSLFYYLIVGKGLVSISKKYAILIIGGILLLFYPALKNCYTNYLPGPHAERMAVHQKKDHRGVARYVTENLQEGDIVFHACCNTIPPFEYYFHKAYQGGFLPERYLTLRLSEDRNRLIPLHYNIESQEISDRSKDVDIYRQKRIWLILSEWEFESAMRSDSSKSRIVRILDNYYIKTGTYDFSGIRVYLYEKIRRRQS